MNKEMSLDVALDIIGTLRMMKIDEISEEKDENSLSSTYKCNFLGADNKQ